ncbi:MAG: ribosome maturation factor RimP [Pseudomonadota bacterium]
MAEITPHADLDGLFRSTVESLGYELVDVEFVRAGRQPLLRLYIDAPEGVTVDDCALVSRQVSALLDVEDVIPGAYRLEVSSPGLDRPLKRREDFVRFAGHKVNLRLHQPMDGQRRFVGELVGVEGGAVLLRVDDDVKRFQFTDIAKTRLVPEF